MIETESLELKREFTARIKKDLVAFANTEGGELIIGIDDDGSVLGVEEPDRLAAQVTNMIRDTIRPDITLISKTKIKIRDNKSLVHVIVNRGNRRPYYIANKGMTSAGVFVRQGNTSAPASADAIREMIRETDNFSYESNLSFEQKLTFEYCTKVFFKKNIKYKKNQMQSMKMIDHFGNYTNLGMLLSDQCFHSIQFACFQGTEIGIFTERQRFTGSLLKQLDDAYSILNRYNRTRSEIYGLHRTDTREYPEEAIREALINAIVHRDYDRDVSTNIRVFDDKIEIVSYGGLPSNTTIETFLLGLSIPRNKNLADVFYRLELIEAFGSGIPKMIRLYRDRGKEIKFSVSPSAFMITLPSLNYEKTLEVKDIGTGQEKEEYLDLNSQRIHLALELIHQKGEISRKELEEAWGVKRSTAVFLLKKMVDEKILERIGNGPTTRYKLR